MFDDYDLGFHASDERAAILDLLLDSEGAGVSTLDAHEGTSELALEDVPY